MHPKSKNSVRDTEQTLGAFKIESRDTLTCILAPLWCFLQMFEPNAISTVLLYINDATNNHSFVEVKRFSTFLASWTSSVDFDLLFTACLCGEVDCARTHTNTNTDNSAQ